MEYTYMSQDDIYLYDLRMYINKNPNKLVSELEFDFLTEEIKKLRSIVSEVEEYNKSLDLITDEQHIKEIEQHIKERIEKGAIHNYEDIEKFKIYELEKRKEKRCSSRVKRTIQNLEIRLNRLHKPEKITKGNFLEGKKLNIVERYKIADDIFSIDKTIRNLNVLDSEKHKLISFILDCNEQTARELYNGTQIKRTPIREDLINRYVENLRK